MLLGPFGDAAASSCLRTLVPRGVPHSRGVGSPAAAYFGFATASTGTQKIGNFNARFKLAVQPGAIHPAGEVVASWAQSIQRLSVFPTSKIGQTGFVRLLSQT